ncbi:MAG TPA: O-antigen ligase family protein [Candidatus Binatia bacterium]
MDKFLEFYGRALFVFLLAATALIGTGGFDFGGGPGISCWSVSRTTFFFWLIWKIMVAVRTGNWYAGWFPTPIFLLLLSFFLVVTVSLIPDFRWSIGDFRYLFFGCVHAVMIMDLFCDEPRLNYLVVVLGIVPGMLFVRGVLADPELLLFHEMRRLGDPLDHANTAGYVLSMSLPLAITIVALARGRFRWVAGASVAAQFAALVLTYSRGAWLGAAAGCSLVSILRKSWKPIAVAALTAMLCFGLIKPLRERFLTFVDPRTDYAMNERVHVMRDAFAVGVHNPVLGVGYGRGRLKQALRSKYVGTERFNQPIWHAHNLYVELFAETGILGLAVFIALIVRTGYELRRAVLREAAERRTRAVGLAGAWTAAVITAIGDIPFYHHETRIFFFTLLGVAVCLSRADQRCSLFARQG